MEFSEQVLKSDVADIQGGTTSEAFTFPQWPGSIDPVQRCFTGLETRGDRIVLSPLWPETLGVPGFPIYYRGCTCTCGSTAARGHQRGSTRLSPVDVERRGQVRRLTPR
jgi:trehalose/maltose hydrolase-like predicted phosphorylase